MGALSGDETAALRRQFDARHCVRLPGLLAPRALEMMQTFVEETPFLHRVHGTIGSELCLPDGRASRLIFFLVNDPALYAAVRHITGCGHIGCFTGRVYRMVPGAGDYDSWHSDVTEQRMVGMSINIGPAYEGGVFQLREAGSKRLLCEAPNVVPGDAILFRIDPRLEHWITPMAGDTPKTAFAGWFRGAPEFMRLMARRRRRIDDGPEW